MTNEQLYLAIGIPVVSNLFMMTIMVLFFNKRIDDLRSEMKMGFDAVNKRMDDIIHRLERLESQTIIHKP